MKRKVKQIDRPADIVSREVRQWLELEDDLLPVVPLVVASANRLSGPPVWLMIVAPPSSGKSDVIMGLSALSGVHQVSTVTPRTFASGMLPRADTQRSRSLLERLRQQGKWLLTLKDFGTIQSLPPLQRNPIFGQLREIYDGKFNANYGTGVEVDWSGKLGMLVGATPAVDRQSSWSAELGERFVQFRPAVPNARKVAMKALEVAGAEDRRRSCIAQAYRDAFAQVMRILRSKDNDYKKLTGYVQRIAPALALFVADTRRPVWHNRYTGGYEVLPLEGPARLAKVFVQLHSAAIVCYDGDQDAAARLVTRIAVDSAPGKRGKLLRELARSPEGVTAKAMSQVLKCDTETARRELEDLVAIGLATSSKPIEATVYEPSTKLFAHGEAVFPDLESPVQSLQKLFDLPNNIKPERERERENERESVLTGTT